MAVFTEALKLLGNGPRKALLKIDEGGNALLFTQGQFIEDEEAYMWRIGAAELWQDYAALCAVPVSVLGYAIGNLMGSDE